MTTFNGTEFCLEVVAADCCVVRRGCGCHGDGQRADVLLRGAASETQTNTTRDYRGGGWHSCQVRLLYATLCFFFCKVAGEKSLFAGCGFLSLFKKNMVAC